MTIMKMGTNLTELKRMLWHNADENPDRKINEWGGGRDCLVVLSSGAVEVCVACFDAEKEVYSFCRLSNTFSKEEVLIWAYVDDLIPFPEAEKEKTERNDNNKTFETLKKAAKPLIKYLCENHNPHATAIVTPTSVEVVEGVMSIPNINDFIVD